MTRKSVRFVLNAIVILMILSASPTGAQDKDPSSYPDINISNGILKTLLQKAYGTYDPIDVYGCYMPGYGLLFVVNPPYKGLSFDFGNLDESIDSTVMSVLNSTMAQYDSSMKRFDSSIARHGFPGRRIELLPNVQMPRIEKKKKPKSDYSEGQYDAAMRFLESYADAENKLGPGQEITVVMLTDYESPGRIFSVAKKNVTSYRNETSTGEQFQKDVDTTFLEAENEEDPVKVIANILNNSFGKRFYVESYVPLTQNTKGVYIKGLGAVFVGQLESGWGNKKVDEEKIEKKVVRVLGDYGSSLRFMPDNESIFVIMDIESFGNEKKDIVIKLKKSDVDSYTRSEIDLVGLQQKASVVEIE